MKVGSKSIIINRNIEKVENDFSILTGSLEDRYNLDVSFKLFYGEINHREFCFEPGYGRRYFIAKLIGKIIEQDKNTTLINIDIFAANIHILFCIIWIISFIPIIINTIIPGLSEQNLFWNIVLLIISLSYPIMYWSTFCYNLRNRISDFYLYGNGYYDKYINKSNVA